MKRFTIKIKGSTKIPGRIPLSRKPGMIERDKSIYNRKEKHSSKLIDQE